MKYVSLVSSLFIFSITKIKSLAVVYKYTCSKLTLYCSAGGHVSVPDNTIIIRKILKTVRNNAHVSNSLHTDNNISNTESDHHHDLTLPTAEKEHRYLHDQYSAKRP